MNTKLHTLCDKQGRPVRLHLTEGQRSDFKGADVLLKNLPKAETLIGDKGYDSDNIRNTLTDQGITPCIPSKRNRKKPRVSDLLCMSDLAHASPTKEHDDNDYFQRITGRAA
jgi:IS5 family transposase